MKKIGCTKEAVGLALSACVLVGWHNDAAIAQSHTDGSQALTRSTPADRAKPGTVRNTNAVAVPTSAAGNRQVAQHERLAPAADAGAATSSSSTGAPMKDSSGTVPSTTLTGSALQIEEAEKRQVIPVEQLQKMEATIVGKYKDGWQMFLQNPLHTGCFDMISPAQGKLHWSFPAEGPIDSSPAVYKGVVYAGSDDTYMYAVDERNGSMLWHTKLGDKIKSSAAVVGGVLYVGCEDKSLYALDARSGKILWSFPTGDRVSSSPLVADGVVFVGSWDGNLYAVDAKTGTLKWKYSTGSLSDSRVTSSPAQGPDSILVTSHSGTLSCLNTSNGALRWQFKTGGKIFASPLVMGGLVYFGSWDKIFYAVELETGKLKWKYSGAESYSVSAAGNGSRVFVENDDLKMYCLDALTGKLFWKTPMNSPTPFLSSAPAIGGNMLYVGSPDAHVYAIDTRNGGIKWKYKTQRPIISSPAISPSGVFIGSQDGNLYQLN